MDRYVGFIRGTRISIYYRLVFVILFFAVFYKAESLSKEMICSEATLAGMSEHELNRMGLLKLREKEYTNAKRYFMLAIKRNPSVKYYYNNISVVCIRLRDYKKARNYLRIAIAIDPCYVKALSNMAVVCFYQLRFKDAYRYYLMARRVDNRYTDERFEFGRIIKGVEKVKDENPENSELELILWHLKNRVRIK
jgi:tetratricopeptide (TPR) repeat protein